MKCNRLNIAMIFASALLGVTGCGGRGDGNRTFGEADSLTAVAELRQRLEEADKSGRCCSATTTIPCTGMNGVPTAADPTCWRRQVTIPQ